MSTQTKEDLPISTELLEILRDPLAVQDKETYGNDPGQLELVHNCWLVSKDTNYKYPIKEGIPVMLIEEGEKWKNTPVEELPVPPGPLVSQMPSPVSHSDGEEQANTTSNLVAYAVVLALVVGLILIIGQQISKKKSNNA